MKHAITAVFAAAAIATVGCSDDGAESGAGADGVQPLSLGETADIGGGMSATVYAVDATFMRDPVLGDKPTDRFLAIDAEVCAEDGGEVITDTTGVIFWLVMADDRRGDLTTVGGKKPTWNYTELNPGACLRGWITYQVMPGVEATAVEAGPHRWQLP